MKNSVWRDYIHNLCEALILNGMRQRYVSEFYAINLVEKPKQGEMNSAIEGSFGGGYHGRSL